ncbi:hypothetical protein JCGZ_16209 [Jatropha curcas]|uniref:Uncharacterized protein n=1 Tax=Jatropha curcas TaxID=180498 RepID=A0A067KFN5_JATCU|nr:hypothetical protein JCGZ_16209 [Jatropha curcas]
MAGSSTDSFTEEFYAHYSSVTRDQFAYGAWLQFDNQCSNNVSDKRLLLEVDVLNGGQRNRGDGPISMESEQAGFGGFDSQYTNLNPNVYKQRVNDVENVTSY